jgi:hypothetical protein
MIVMECRDMFDCLWFLSLPDRETARETPAIEINAMDYMFYGMTWKRGFGTWKDPWEWCGKSVAVYLHTIHRC